MNSLTAEFFNGIATGCRRFDRVSVVINNVSDIESVRKRCDELARTSVIDGYCDVAAQLPHALLLTGLARSRLEPRPHYTDHFLVKVCQPGPRWLVHWDTDVVLDVPGDWVTPAIALMQRRVDVATATPRWPDGWSLDQERLSTDGAFDLGYGFSDQVFLIERARFAAPIYRKFCPASWWYPTSHLTPIFEQRVDAWMRRSRLQRAVYRQVSYKHDERMANQPRGTAAQRARRKAQRLMYEAAQQVPGRFQPALHRRPNEKVRS